MGHAPTPAESPTILTRGSARRRHHAVSWSVPYGRAGGWRAADNGITNRMKRVTAVTRTLRRPNAVRTPGPVGNLPC
jgi:hypothetical protein